MKIPIRFPINIKHEKRNVGIIGCGQFATSTIGYFLKKNRGNIFVGCYDIDRNKAESFAWYYKCKSCNSFEELIGLQDISILYIASNHSTHTDYAIKCLALGKTVFVEKPLSTSKIQFRKLQEAISANPNTKIFLGYNRPFSPAIEELRNEIQVREGAVTLNCYISGHKIASTHWYRRPEEGTRICGNLGHWIDLSINLLWSRAVKPTQFQIQLSYADLTEPDDNLTISLVSNRGDLITITLSSRGEPFEGINETISFQCDDVICKIDDFRRMTLWKESFQTKRRYFRKNVGHELSVLQPFNPTTRNWQEVEISTDLMLSIAELVIQKKSHGILNVLPGSIH